MLTSERADACLIALAELLRGSDRILVSPMAPFPRLAARLARATFAPEIVLTDGQATIVDLEDRPVGAMPFSRVFDTLWSGRRHVIMGASQLDVWGNQNISCMGDPSHPKVQLLGARGAPGNSTNHLTSYWVPEPSPRVLVAAVDVICGVGGRDGGHSGGLVTGQAAFDFGAPGGRARLRSLHAGVSLEEVRRSCNWDFDHEVEPRLTRSPTAEESGWLDRLDPERKVRAVLR